MILRRLAQAIRNQNWSIVLIEVLVVVVGIFLGLQVDGWNEARKDRILERRYLERLADEISQDIDEIKDAIELAWDRRDMGELLLRSLQDPAAARENPTDFITAIYDAGSTYLPAISDSTYEEIKFSGKLGIIRNEALRQSITAYYKLVERNQQWNYVREAFQVGYLHASLGILTPDQLKKIDNIWRDTDPEYMTEKWEFTVDEAEQALARMREKQEFIDQIPVSASKAEDIYFLRSWLQAATTLHDAIIDELDRI